MASGGARTYVGFGFGAIQAGLFLYEAFRSGNFRSLTVAEVAPELVRALRGAGGRYRLNIARTDRVEAVSVGPVAIHDPTDPADRAQLVEALAAADEIGTAVPSVNFYETPGPASLHRLLAEGLAAKARAGAHRAVVYAAENHNSAAEILEDLTLREVPPELRGAVRGRVRFLNTVIGKMSGTVASPAESGLATVTPESPRAFLVEEFNRILVSQPRFPEPFARGLAVFEEKDDLRPFEEAKLFGHNATHAMAAYLGMLLGVRRIAELRDVPGFMPFLRAAFLDESGAALIRRHRGVDRLFTPDGCRDYADDLLSRMTNPFLLDTAERVGRDAGRKLGWDDRLVGAMRLVLAEGLVPRRCAVGAAAALAEIDPEFAGPGRPAADALGPLWAPAQPPRAEEARVLGLIEAARRFLESWRAAGRPPLEEHFQQWPKKP